MDIEVIARQVVDAIFKVHSSLGPGLLESTYQTCLSHELRQRGIKVENEVQLPVRYREVRIDAGYRIDMLVESLIVIENKSVDQILPIHKAQLLTYMKLGDFHLGFLVNWNVELIKNGINRTVLNLSEPQWQLDHKEFKKS